MSSTGTPAKSSNGLSPKSIVAAVIAVVALVFVFQNTSETKVKFLGFTITTWAWLMYLCLFVAGVLVGLLLAWMRRDKK